LLKGKKMRLGKWIFVAGMLLSGSAHAEVKYYLMQEVAQHATDAELRAQAVTIQSMYDELSEVSGVKAELYYSTDPDINAFATELEKRKKVVVVQDGLIQMLEDDREAVAAVLGHELAHHKADHVYKGRKKQEGIRVFGAILGAVVGAKVGQKNGYAAGALSGAVVAGGANLIAISFSRNQELEADRLSMQWLHALQYNPHAMLRLQKRLAKLEGKSKKRNSILSTHPRSEKRYQTAKKALLKMNVQSSSEEDSIAALVTEQDLDAAKSSIAQEQEVQLASLLVPMEAPAAALIAPLEKINFERYAAISNELFREGDSKKNKILAQHKVSLAAWEKADRTFALRAQKDKNIIQYLNVLFFRATTGKMKRYGKELADSYEKGQSLKLDPPFSIEVAVSMSKTLEPYRGQSPQGETRAEIESDLSVFGFNYYEYTIGMHWWKRKATIAALVGDTTLYRQLML
jgi:predicted Zn-dependent protease